MRYVFTLLLFIHVAPTFAQKLAFDVILFGDKIGQTVVEQTNKGDTTIVYQLNSNSEAHILFTTHKVTLHYELMFKRDQLISAYSKGTTNGKADVTTINWQGNRYFMKRHDGNFYVNVPVYCSTTMLFFNEPCDGARVFSERMGEFRTIRKIEEGVYKADMQDGLTYYYRYKGGKLIELEMRRGILGSAYLRPAK